MYVWVDMYNIVTKVFRKRFLDISRIAFIQKLRNAELVNINILSTLILTRACAYQRVWYVYVQKFCVT